MLSITSLLSPLIIGFGVMMGVVILDARTIYVRGFDVPQAMSQQGYSGGVFERKVIDQVRLIERTARTRPETRRLALDSEKSTLDLIAGYFGVEPLVRAIQGSSELLEYAVAGEIVARGDEFVLSMRTTHYGGALSEFHIAKPKTDVDGLVQATAEAIVRIVDPQILCASRLRVGLATNPPDLGAAEKCVLETVETAAYVDRPWLWTLAGVIEFLRNDRAAAARYFARAVKLDPDFSPALLNIGILYSLEGRHIEAIKAYRLVFRRPSPEDSPQTYAAALVEWGDSLIALGLSREGERKYRQAIRYDGDFLLAYHRLLAVKPPGPRRDALQAKAAGVARRADQLYTENLLGLIRDAAHPKP